MAFRLHDLLPENLVSFLTHIGVALAIPTLMVTALLTPQLSRGMSPVTVADDATRSPETIEVEEPDDGERDEIAEGDGPVDLYGNDITDAVAKYKFDATGSLYETHSPQTELPRLGSPKS